MKMRKAFIAVVGGIVLATGAIGDARADRCGRGDRVTLPSCVSNYVRSNSYWARNYCDYTVTIKADIKNGSDHRFDLDYDESRSHHINEFDYNIGRKRVRSLSCCPRYNRCS